MRRWAFNLAAGVALLLCVATAVLWGASYGGHYAVAREHQVIYQTGNGWVSTQSLAVTRGRFVWQWQKDRRMFSIPELQITEVRVNQPPPPDVLSRQVNWSWEQSPAKLALPYRSLANRLGFYAELPVLAYNGSVIHMVQIPCWLALLLSAVLPAVWIVRRRRRRQEGCCHVCGYDLRASPGRCPECGMVPAAGAA